jgi:alpha-tubulin suppressor-like RCC1 family protein
MRQSQILRLDRIIHSLSEVQGLYILGAQINTANSVLRFFLFAGYSCENEGHNQLVPRLVISGVKRIGLKKLGMIVQVVASKFHSAALSDTGKLYTWGLNIGQLGHDQPHGTIQMSPKKALLPVISGDIVQICCTNSATAIMVKNGSMEVHVLSSFEPLKKILFPWTDPSKPSFGIKAHQKQERQVIDRIVSGNQHFAALTSLGEVFMWKPAQVIYN